MGTFSIQSFTNPNQSFLLLAGQSKRIKVEFTDVNGLYYDPVSVAVTVYKPDNSVFFTETYSGTSVNVLKASTGNYYVDFIGDTNLTGDYQFVWAWQDTAGGESFNGFQSVFMVPIHVFSVIPYLRNQVDKAQKDVGNIFGYTDGQLYMFLKGGLSEINRVPPNTSFTFQNYPYNLHQQLLVDISTFVALVSQSLVAVDTDANYSMQGNSMTIDHFSKLSSFLNLLQNRMNLSLKHFKLNYLTRIGAVKVERGPGFRQVATFQSAPSGISFGNVLGVR